MRSIFYGCFAIIFFLTGCAQTEVDRIVQDSTSLSEQAEKEKLTLEETSEALVHVLKDHDMKALADFIHLTKGVRFSPYGYIDVENDQLFSAEEVITLWEDPTVYHWGHFDGTGEPIDMTFPEYYDRFVYDEDYANAEETAVDERLGHGNTLDNTKEVYPSASVVEFHFSGFDEQYDGMDWRSLRLVLKQENEKWYLVSIIHDEWTI